jgi:fatty acid desaturase
MKKIFLLSTIALFFAASSFALPPQQKHHKHHKHHKHAMKHDKDKKSMDKKGMDKDMKK